MDNGYRPHDPQGKLHEIVTRWIASMRLAGHSPNRGVVFGEDDPSMTTPQTLGFLVDDRRAGAGEARYLFLEDGDALRHPADVWLRGPDDEVVTLLARSLADARLGGGGWLAEVGAEAGSLERVPDRRTARVPHAGPERRGA